MQRGEDHKVESLLHIGTYKLSVYLLINCFTIDCIPDES